MSYYYCANCGDSMPPDEVEDEMCPWCDLSMELIEEEEE